MTTNKESNPLHGLVLAGGRSRRMGQDKALLKHDGQSQLAFAMNLLAEVTDRAFVSTSTAHEDDPERARFDRIVDRYDDLGPVAGILSAMDAYPDADWLVVACDLPNLDTATLEGLVARRDGANPFVAYRSSYDDLPEPLCAIYKAGSDSVLRAFVDDGMNCPRKMLIRSDTLLLTQSNAGSLDNINTPDDLAGSVLGAST